MLKDSELDDMCRAVRGCRGKLKESLEYAIKTASVPERLIDEYRDLKAIHENEHQSLVRMNTDYTSMVKNLDERTRLLMASNRKIEELNKQIQECEDNNV